MAILHSRPTADRYISHYFSNAVFPKFPCSLRRQISSGAHKNTVEFLSLFRNIAKETFSFVTFVSLFFRMEQLGSHWKDCHEI
jgi:hypothetical protein